MIFPLSFVWRALWTEHTLPVSISTPSCFNSLVYQLNALGSLNRTPPPSHSPRIPEASSPPGLDWNASLCLTLGSLRGPQSACRKTPQGVHSPQCPEVSRKRMDIRLASPWQWEFKVGCLIFSSPANWGWRTGLYEFSVYHNNQSLVRPPLFSSVALACFLGFYVEKNGKTLKVSHSGISAPVLLAYGE